MTVALASTGTDSTMVGRSAVMCSLRWTVSRAAKLRRTTLVTGPTGSGKELVARELHDQSSRRDKPFVVVHCGALPEQIIESELFGHERGAFTGALHRRSGLACAAHRGTLFLDEVNSLPISAQSRLLRFLENGEYRAVGSDRIEQSDAWVIAATNRNLRECVRDNQFREDLLYRLEVIRVDVPPLSLRGEDVVVLAQHFLRQVAGEGVEFADDAVRTLRHHHWPGNVRELKHRVESAALMCSTGVVDAFALGVDATATPRQSGVREAISADAPALEAQLWALIEHSGMTLSEAVTFCEEAIISQALRHEDHNRTRAADKLGIHVRTMFKKLSSRER
jgi:DNA-binding NtrC family response regulator